MQAASPTDHTSPTDIRAVSASGASAGKNAAAASGNEVVVQRLIAELSMQPHPEGGYYAQTYKSELTVAAPWAPARSAATAIHFLMTPNAVSRLHRLKADEVWHFYGGGPITVVELLPDGSHRETVLGPLDAIAGVAAGAPGPRPVSQHVVAAGAWFGSFPNAGSAYSLVGCTVSPGFEFDDFELGSRAALLRQYPGAESLVVKLTEGLP